MAVAERPLDENAILRQWHSRLDGLLSAAIPRCSQFSTLIAIYLSVAPARLRSVSSHSWRVSFEGTGRANTTANCAALKPDRDIHEIGKRVTGGDRHRHGRSWEHGVRDRYVNLVESYEERRCPGEEDPSLFASE